MKKRILLVLLALLVVVMFAFASCKEESSDNGDDSSDTATDTATDTTTNTDTATECTHEWGEGEITKDPTCKKDGEKVYTCSKCNETKKETISKSDEYHQFAEEPVLIGHDCAKKIGGTMVKRCTVPGCDAEDPSYQSQQINYQDLLDKDKVVVEATCTKTGYSFYKCTMCFDEAAYAGGSFKGVVDYKPEPVLGHDMQVVNSTPATCTEPAIEDKKCSRCDYEELGVEGEPAKGHNYEGQPKLTKEPTCEENGYYYYECVNCPGDEEGFKIAGSDTTLLKKGHTIDINDPEYTIRTPATCITDGSIIPICKVCEKEVPDMAEIDYATGVHHTTYDVVSSVPASCHNDAYEVRRCTADPACGLEENFYEEGTRKDHNFVKSGEPVAPTCQSKGYTLEICTECNTGNASTCEDGCWRHVDIKDEVPHSIGTITENSYVPATCTKQAYVYYTCGFCGFEYEYKYPTEDAEDLPEVDGKTYVPLIAHDASIAENWKRSDERVYPTCTQEGYTRYYCVLDQGCNEYIEKDVTIRKQHTFTVYEDGRLVCADCKVTYRDITTYNSTPIESSKDEGNGPLTFTDANGNEISLDWDVIGYGKPDTTNNKVTAGTPYTKNGFELSMASGIVAMKLVDGMEATVTVKDSDGNATTYTITADQNESLFNVIITRDDGETVVKSNYLDNEFTVIYGDMVYIDLYANEDVAEITVESNVDTTASLYSKQ